MTEDTLADFLNKLNDLASDYGLVVGGYQQEEGMLQLLMVKAIGEDEIMEKYRPKEYTMYIYGTEQKACIDCYPQSRWELVSMSDGEVALLNRHTTIHLTIEDFEKHWVKVNEKG